ncbi:flagellar hook-length control protein FliK [Zavarzinia compransoris]|nr:flagellar hook-length control protein FliK [Zavarzinia marina]
MDVFEISLTPDDLGRVDVRLEFGEDGRVAAHVYADRPETLAMLQRDRGDLARALAGQGVNADASNLTFSLRGDEQGARNFAGGDGGAGQRDGGRRGQGRGRGAAAFAATEAAAARPAFTRSRAIDIAV